MNILQSGVAETLYNKLIEIADNKEYTPEYKIPRIRSVLENLFTELTRREIQTFANLHARMLFVFDKYEVETGIVDCLHNFRKLANRVLHEENFIPTENDYLYCLKNLVNAIFYFSDCVIPENLKPFAQISITVPQEKQNTTQRERIPFLRAVLLEKPELKKSKDSEFCSLKLASDEQGLEKFNLNLWTSAEKKYLGQNYSDFANMAWKYATINLFDIEKVANRDSLYTSTPQTLVVLEPDYLIDITEISECFQVDFSSHQRYSNPNIALLKKFVTSDKYMVEAFRGTVVGKLLNTYMVEPQKPYIEALEEALREDVLKTTRVGLNVVKAELEQAILQNHLPNIRMFANLFAGKRAWVEPTFLSSQFGLQGRLDVMIQNESDPERKDICELKSGKPHANEVWETNRMQVVGYNLLLRSVFSGKRKGTSSIFFSQANENPIRNVSYYFQLDQDFLMLRNRIVAQHMRLAYGKTENHCNLTSTNFGEVPSIVKSDLDYFEKVLANQSDIALAYFFTYVGFIFRELRTAKIGSDEQMGEKSQGFSSLWLQDTVSDKLATFSILNDLHFNLFDACMGTVTMKRDKDKKSVVNNFRVGDICILYPQDLSVLRPLHYPIIKCAILSLTAEDVVLELRNKQPDQRNFASYKVWAIEHDFMENSYHSLLQSMFDVLDATEERKNIILGLQEPRFRPLESVKIDNLQLNDNQRDLLQRALAAQDYFLIQGPPGTGKTSFMLVEMVKNIFFHTDEVITIVAFTNRAVSEICHKLDKIDMPYLRLGNGEGDKVLMNKAKKDPLLSIESELKKCRILVSTVQSFMTRRKDLRTMKTFETIIVDEASQLLEPHLSGLLCMFKKFILIGDQNQLPAVVIQKVEKCLTDNKLLNGVGVTDLRQSLFERLMKRSIAKNWKATGLLTHHFRMHSEIAALVNPYYFNQLKVGKPEQNEPWKLIEKPNNSIESLLASSRLIYIETKKEYTTKQNSDEAMVTVAILKTLQQIYGNHLKSDSIGVITTWRAQINNIISRIDDEKLLEYVTIDTVERFQGSERDIIIISPAVYHQNQLNSIESITINTSEIVGKDGNPQSIEVDRKLNVAISRARKQVILLGCYDVLRQSNHYLSILNQIVQKGKYLHLNQGMTLFGLSESAKS